VLMIIKNRYKNFHLVGHHNTYDRNVKKIFVSTNLGFVTHFRKDPHFDNHPYLSRFSDLSIHLDYFNCYLKNI
jgi:hypothetical protein